MALPFTTEDWYAHLRNYDLPDLNAWLVSQVDRGGVEFYRTRIGMLDFQGERVLDAGCGAGNWAIALSSYFDAVEAIDTDPRRLQIVIDLAPKLGNLNAQFGSTEALEYPDSSFDGVFCSGVVFITDVEKTVGEFGRILKPGGKLYMSFVGSAWWTHLLLERSKTEPSCIKFGSDGLISLYFRRLDELAIEQRMPAGTAQLARVARRRAPAVEPAPPVARLFSRLASAVRPADPVTEATSSRDLLSQFASDLRSLPGSPLVRRQAADAATALDLLQREAVPASYAERIKADLVSRVVSGRGDYSFDVHSYTYEPEDMSALLVRHGFVDIQVASEGGLRLSPQRPTADPIYARRLGVYETVCRKG